MPQDILIVDDEKNIRRSLRGILEDEGYTVDEAETGSEALDTVKQSFYRTIFLDVKLPDADGIAVLKEIRHLSPESSVIIISGHATIEMAVEATRSGAYTFFEKPLIAEKVLLELEHLKQHRTLEAEMKELKKYAEFDEMIGSSPLMQELKRLIARIAPSEGRVFITGENGTGKELVARAIHYASSRKNKPFIKINCAALPKDLIESELFGYEKGAFTGASARKIGQIELAHTGTLFLDEIGDMSLDTQAKLLRVLEENEFIRLGGNNPISFNVRIISATNHDLEQKIIDGTFREDLYHRLRVIPVAVPPLRQRREDIPELAYHFMAQCAIKNGKRPVKLHASALCLLQEQEWRGNVRELRNVMERIAIMTDKSVVSADDIDIFLPHSGAAVKDLDYPVTEGNSLREMTDSFVESILLQEYNRCGGNVSKIAAKLKIDRANLHRKLKAFGIK